MNRLLPAVQVPSVALGGGRWGWRSIAAKPSWFQWTVTVGSGVSCGITLLALTYALGPVTEDAWIIASLLITGVIWLLLARRAIRNMHVIFEPMSIYPAVYATIFTIGTWNITGRGGQIDPSILAYFGLGLGFYYLGGLLFGLFRAGHPRHSVQHHQSSWRVLDDIVLWRCAHTLVIVGLSSLALAWVFAGGIPIFDESLRLGLNSYLVALSQSSWVGLVLSGAVFHRMPRWDRACFILLVLSVVIMLIMGGYRAPIVLGGLTAVIAIGLGSQRGRLRFAIATGVVLLIASTLIPFIRESWKYGYFAVRSTYIRQGIPEPLVLMGPIYAVAREGPLIFSILKDEMRGSKLGGRLMLSDWQSMLPGKQDNSRMIVRNLIANPTDTSKTPSVIGTLYVDFGVYGICIGMCLLSLVIHWLHDRWRKTRSLPALLIYALTLSYSLISIYTGGYCEPVYVLSCAFIGLIPRVAKRMSELA